MAKDGYIIFPKSITEEYPWNSKSPLSFKVFLSLVLDACYLQEYIDPSGVKLLYGQVFTSSRKIAVKLGISRNTIRHILERLEHAHQVTQQHAHNGIVITICNYDRFREYKQQNTPTNTPTNTQRVAQSECNSGTKIAPPLYKTNNHKSNDEISTKSEIQNDEIPWLRESYPFSHRESLKQHLIARNYTEHEACLFMESFYSKEYTGKAAMV